MSDTAPPLPTAPYVVIGLVVTGWPPDALLRGAADALGAGKARPLLPAPRATTIAFETADAGVVLIASRVDEGDHRFVAVDVSVSGELLGGPSRIPLSPEEEAERERSRDLVKRALEALCARLEPLYAGVGVEWRTPVPTALREDRLPCDVFWSFRLEAVDPSLATDLDDIYGVPGRPFQRGRLIAAGGLLDDDATRPLEPLAAGRAAANRLAYALASMSSDR